jgi:hypothetical protein
MKEILRKELLWNAYQVWGKDTEGLENSIKCINIEFANMSENEAVEKYYQVVGLKKYEISYHTKHERIWCDQCIKTTLIYAKNKTQAKEIFKSDIKNMKQTIISVYLMA